MRLRALAAALACLAALATSSAARAALPTKQECVTANEQAHRLRRENKLQQARAQLIVCTAESCPGPVRADSLLLLEEVKKAEPTIVFAVKDAAGNDLTAVRVMSDGAVVAERLDGSALPIDPGEHTFRFEAAGVAPVEKKLLIREGETNRREPIVLALVPPPIPSQPAITPPPALVPARDTARPAPSGWPARRIGGIAVASAGVVAIGIGSAFGIIAIQKKHEADPYCHDGNTCNAYGFDLRRAALADSYASTGLFVAGAALAGTGLALIFVPAPAQAAGSARLTLVPAANGLILEGSW